MEKPPRFVRLPIINVNKTRQQLFIQNYEMNTRKREGNAGNEDMFPCLDESKLSMKCLDESDYDYKKCILYFENYNNCKKFWGRVQSSRKAAGIKPYMPTKEERIKIMEKRRNGIDAISAS